ncbi:hypothetical protein TNCV_138911 [Trichonephila clavipes]|nr:hypothetical protein TNCV_138911 [Trichonephila clavipes]
MIEYWVTKTATLISTVVEERVEKDKKGEREKEGEECEREKAKDEFQLEKLRLKNFNIKTEPNHINNGP